MLKTHLEENCQSKKVSKIVSGNGAYKSDDPVSKSIIKVWPPILTGARNSTSLCVGLFVTSPASLDPMFNAVISSRASEAVDTAGIDMPHFEYDFVSAF